LKEQQIIGIIERNLKVLKDELEKVPKINDYHKKRHMLYWLKRLRKFYQKRHSPPRVIDSLGRQRQWKLISELKNRYGCILDIGCGWGWGYWHFVVNDNYIVGLDIGNTFVKFEKELSDIDFIQADGYKIPFNDNTFDVVLLLDVIEHIQDDYDFLWEAKRVLREGGVTISMTPNRERLS